MRLGVTDLGRGTNPWQNIRSWPREIAGTCNPGIDQFETYLLQAPPQQDLSRLLSILLHHLLHLRIIEPLTPHNRTICFENNISLLTPLHNVRSRQPRMKLPLPNTDFAAGTRLLAIEFLDMSLKLIKVINTIIRNTQRADFTCSLEFK